MGKSDSRTQRERTHENNKPYYPSKRHHLRSSDSPACTFRLQPTAVVVFTLEEISKRRPKRSEDRPRRPFREWLFAVFLIGCRLRGSLVSVFFIRITVAAHIFESVTQDIHLPDGPLNHA